MHCVSEGVRMKCSYACVGVMDTLNILFLSSLYIHLTLSLCITLSVNCVELVRGETGIRQASASNLTKVIQVISIHYKGLKRCTRSQTVLENLYAGECT